MFRLEQINNTTITSVPKSLIGVRIDIALSAIITDTSRNRIQSLIKDQKIKVNDNKVIVSYRLLATDKINFCDCQLAEDSQQLGVVNTNDITIDELQNIIPVSFDIDIIYEDEDILIINKPAGLVVHPGVNNHTNTLMNALLAKYTHLYQVPRAGIVHRIDKDTSGLLVVAKNLSAHHSLVTQLSNRLIKRLYLALAYGHLSCNGKISANIKRDRIHRNKMAITHVGGKEAVTNYKIIEYLPQITVVECSLETGRTHQIRVHMQYLGFPLLADPVYGQNKKAVLINQFAVDKSDTMHPLLLLNRQALHAKKLVLNHPRTGAELNFSAPIPKDVSAVIDYLRTMPENLNKH